MVFVVENEITDPLNVGSNKRTPLKEIVEIITKGFNPIRRVNWDTTKPTGDAVRVLDSSRLVNKGFQHEVSLEDGIQETINWFLENQETIKNRYNPFTEK